VNGARLGLVLILAPWAIAALLVGVRLSLNPADEAEVTARIEAQAHERKAVRPEACISVYEAGERWTSSHARTPTCASAARLVPAHVMSMPVAQ